MKTLKLYDSLSQTRKSLPNKHLKLYLCGPTVYDDIHVGNIAPVIFFDFLIRYIRERGINYTYIHNITDIDDKIVAKAQQLNFTESEISNLYFQKYVEILKKLNIVFPTHMPKVSEHIKEIQDVVKNLIEKDYAEMNGEDIVFKFSKVNEYGELSKQKLESLTNVSDFCLWKRMKEGKTWPSEWGDGRPGWHTECFAFIEKYAKGKVDIHGGGIDLKFPHHENENAHCRALHGTSLADIWVHIGHLHTEAGKISKSNNKKFLLKDLLENYSSNDIRFIFLTNNYSLPTIISNEKLKFVKEEVNSFIQTINKAKSILFINGLEINPTSCKISKEFLSHIENDLNMPEVLTWLQKIKKELGTHTKNKQLTEISHLLCILKTHLEWLGFEIPDMHNQEIKNLLLKWNEYMKNKNYEESDKLRNLLSNKQII